MESCTSYPEFSAIALGIISNASANEDNPIWHDPRLCPSYQGDTLHSPPHMHQLLVRRHHFRSHFSLPASHL